jgi:hypothetical protein
MSPPRSLQLRAFPWEQAAYKIVAEAIEGISSCRLAFSRPTFTERPTCTKSFSRQSSGIVLLPYSSGEICFLPQGTRQFNPDMKILFKAILPQLSQESAMS